jgi:hypothetical protein
MTKHSGIYEQLSHFISHEMRMSHVYQPVMLRELLRRKGTVSVNDVAKALLAEDRSQVEYYEQITKIWSDACFHIIVELLTERDKRID